MADIIGDVFKNADLNALSSAYAAAYQQGTTDLIRRVVHNQIYNGTRQQFYDLSILDMQTPLMVATDEDIYGVKTYGRAAIVASSGATGGSSITIPTTDTSMVAVDNMVCFPDNTKGIVDTITTDTSIVVKPLTNGTVPNVVTNDVIVVMTPIEADAATDIKTFWRMPVSERSNYIQMYVKGMKFGRMELEKYKRAGTFNDYLSKNREEFLNQVRIDRSNVYWNGTKGQVTLKNGDVAKTTEGIYPAMVAAGTTTVSATPSTIGTSLEDAAIATNHMAYGGRRFAYMTPEVHLVLSKYYKDTLTRYKPNDMIANLMLDEVRIGDSIIVFVPMARWKDEASFPSHFQSKILLLDQEQIIPTYFFGEEYGSTLGRVNNGTLNNFSIDWVSMTFGQRYINPHGGAIVNISGL